jgi:hypothetical protein
MRLIVCPDCAQKSSRSRKTRRTGRHTLRSSFCAELGLRRFPRSARPDRLGRSQSARRFHRAQSAARDPQPHTLQHQPLPAQQHFLSQLPVSRCRSGSRLHTRFTKPNDAEIARLRATEIVRIRKGRRAETPGARADLQNEPAVSRVPAVDRSRRRPAAPLRHLLRARRITCTRQSQPLGLDRLARRIPRSRQPRRRRIRPHPPSEILFHGWLQWLVDGRSPRFRSTRSRPACASASITIWRSPPTAAGPTCGRTARSS